MCEMTVAHDCKDQCDADCAERIDRTEDYAGDQVEVDEAEKIQETPMRLETFRRFPGL